MSDFNVNQIVQSTGLPTDLNYELKKAGVGAKSKRILFPSTQVEYVGSSSASISIPIPTGTPGQYLDPSQSYLSFKITNTTTNNTGAAQSARLGGNCNCVFRRYELYSNNGSNQIKDCIGYNVLYNMMMDAQVNQDERTNYMGLMMGTTESQEGFEFTIDVAAVVDPPTPAVVGVNNRLFNTNLLCGFMNGEKYIPLGAIKSGDLELRFSLEEPSIALKTSDGTDVPGYTITEVNFVGQIVELDSENEKLVQLSSGGVFAWGSEEYLNHNTSVDTSNSKNILVPFNKGSLKSIYMATRLDVAVDEINNNESLARTKNNLKSYQYSIGTEMIPPAPINCENNATVCSELLRSFHSINYPSGGIISSENFDTTYFLGTELENFSNKNEVLQSGIDTTSSMIYYKGNYEAPAAARIDFFGLYDCIYIIDALGNLDIRS